MPNLYLFKKSQELVLFSVLFDWKVFLLPNERRIGKTSRSQELKNNKLRSHKHRERDKGEEQGREKKKVALIRQI